MTVRVTPWEQEAVALAAMVGLLDSVPPDNTTDPVAALRLKGRTRDRLQASQVAPDRIAELIVDLLADAGAKPLDGLGAG